MIILQPRDIVSREEFDRLFAAEPDEEMRNLYVMLYLTGVRLSEALALERHHITFEGNKMNVRITPRKRKTKAVIYTHELPINIDIAPYGKVLREFLIDLPPFERIWPMSVRTVERYIKRASIKGGVNPPIWPHLFRHTRLTRLAEAGATPQQLMAWAGWADMRYAGTYVQRTKRLIENLADVVT